MSKKIGIISREEQTFEQSYKVFNKEIVSAIKTFHHLPIGIIIDCDDSSNEQFREIKQVIDLCDGIILQGGIDFYPIDQKIVQYLHGQNIPTFGICLGMQEMAVTIGGKIQKLPSLKHHKDQSYVHLVNISRLSLLYRILKKDQILVNSRHKEMITRTKLYVGAYSDDQVIEEVEDQSKQFFLGVQWHPESIFDDQNSWLLFQYFFNKIKET